MFGRNYPRQDLVGFGSLLFSSGDLDPIYIAAQGSSYSPQQLARWLVAYWLFYAAGFASYASEHSDREFWRVLARAAVNADLTPIGGRWPRGSERRHFRGPRAVEAVRRLHEQYSSAQQMVDFLTTGGMDVSSVISRARGHYLFGDWISFKIADMLDALIMPVRQDDISVFLYDSPRKSILENIRLGTVPVPTGLDEAGQLAAAMKWLGKKLKNCSVPHKPGAQPDLFCLETVWCKHLSHMHGHYPPLKDVVEIHEGVQPWVRVCSSAGRFKAHLPPQPKGGTFW